MAILSMDESVHRGCHRRWWLRRHVALTLNVSLASSVSANQRIVRMTSGVVRDIEWRTVASAHSATIAPVNVASAALLAAPLCGAGSMGYGGAH